MGSFAGLGKAVKHEHDLSSSESEGGGRKRPMRPKIAKKVRPAVYCSYWILNCVCRIGCQQWWVHGVDLYFCPCTRPAFIFRCYQLLNCFQRGKACHLWLPSCVRLPLSVLRNSSITSTFSVAVCGLLFCCILTSSRFVSMVPFCVDGCWMKLTTRSLSVDLFWNKVTLCEHIVHVSREGPCCFQGLPVFLCVLWWCCFLAGLSTLVFWWPLQRRGVAGKGVEGGAEMEGMGDEHCCGLHHHHHPHQHPHHHHHHHHHHDLHEDSLGSDSSLGAQSDLSEDSTQVRLLAQHPGSLHATCPSAVLPLLCRHPALQSRLLWATALMKHHPCWHGTLSEDASWPETIETANISSCGLRMVVLSVSVQHKYSSALNLSS